MLGLRWKEAKSRLVSDIRRASKSSDAAKKLALLKPDNIKSSQEWNAFINEKLSEEFELKSKKFKTIRAKNKIPHTMSRKGYARLAEEMKKESDCPLDISRDALWCKGHTKKNGEPPNSVVAECIAKIKEHSSNTQSSQGMTSLREDGVAKIFGREHCGRVRGLGYGVLPSHMGVHMSASKKMCALENQVTGLQTQLQELTNLFMMESLKYRLLGSEGDIGSWGHEYVRNLAGEISQEFAKRQYDDMPIDALMELVQQIVAFHMKHNAEPEAVDLLMEVEDLDLLVEHVDKTNYKRTCLYLISSSSYLPSPDDMLALDIAFTIYVKFEDFTSALRIALALENIQYVKQVFTSTKDLLLKKQFCYNVARHGLVLELDDELVADDEERETLQDIINNSKLSEGFLTLARDIEVMEPKSPEDIYKVHLIDGRTTSSSNLDSARQNLAATFVNAFVNAGFGQDKLMTVASESSGSGGWLFKNKEHGKTSAAASLGMILLWDVDSGLAQIDKFLHSNDTHVAAGALLGVGIVNCGIKSDCDPALALLIDYVHKEDSAIRIGAILGLGIAYAGSQKEEIKVRLSQILGDPKTSLEVLVFSSVTLGLVYVGSCNEEIAQTIILTIMERSETELGDPLVRLLPVALGLLYLGKQESVEATAEVAKTFNEKIRKHCDVTLLSMAYAGTGNVLKVQKLLGYCAPHLEKGETHQGSAVLGIALVAMAEELGLEMAIRSLEHLLQYGEQNIRRAVPLALGILCISNPKVTVMDTLSRLSHDADADVSMAAIVSLGLIGSGTNNARIAGMLRNLSSYYYKEAGHLFCVRIAQGLVHMGKGLMTLSPYHSERFLLSPTALAGLVTVTFACLDMKHIIMGKFHYMLYLLVLAMQPRMLMTVDENLKPLSVPVRVGQAVDVVGQAGRPKTITGFQTHSTPVLLAAGDRAELATEKYIPLTSILEGFVILRENPDYREDQ